MNNYTLLKSILSHPWAITPSHAEAYYPAVMNLFKGIDPQKHHANETQTIYATILTAGAGKSSKASFSNNTPSANNQVVAVIPVKDVIVKYSVDCGPVGTETIASWIAQADQNPKVAAIVLDFDSGGGDGMAMPFISKVIRDTSKPIIAYCGNGITASAAYGIASNCDEIYATFNTDEIGSIGTYITIADFKGYYEKQGLKVHEIYASKSTDKNKPFMDALDGNYDNLRKNVIDPFNEQFISMVQTNRPNVNKEVFTGKLYTAQDAIKMGLIDGFKTLDEVISRAFELAGITGSNDSSKNSNSNTMFGKKTTQFAALIAFAAAKPEERTQEMLDAVNSELQSSGIDGVLMERSSIISRDAFQAEQTARTNAETALNTANERITELESLAKENNIPLSGNKSEGGASAVEDDLTDTDKEAARLKAKLA